MAFSDCTLYNFFFASGIPLTEEGNSVNRSIYKIFDINPNSTSVNVIHLFLTIGEAGGPSGCYDYSQFLVNNTNLPPSSSRSLWDSNLGFERSIQCFTGNNPFYFYGQKDLAVCRNSSNCSIGYRFVSDSSVESPGSFVQDFILMTWAPTPTAYSNLNGTSMASPYAAGVAALLRAYNPSFTYQDTLNKMIEGGTSETALTDTTKYGKAVNANNSMKSLDQISGVTAELQ